MSVKIDLRSYERQKKPSIDWYYSKGRQDAGYTIGTLSCYTFVPCIIVALWIGEERGFDEEVLNKIKSLVKFYGYDTLLGAPKNLPEGIFKVLER